MQNCTVKYFFFPKRENKPFKLRCSIFFFSRLGLHCFLKCRLYTLGYADYAHLNFKPLSGSKIFTISQHKIVFAILLNGNGIHNTSITQNSITICYPLDRTICSVSLYIQSYMMSDSNMNSFPIRKFNTANFKSSKMKD